MMTTLCIVLAICAVGAPASIGRDLSSAGAPWDWS